MRHARLTRALEGERATVALGEALGRALAPHIALPPAWLVFLVGPLGAGKTTFARGVLRALGHRGLVKSPTFTIVEPYELGCPVRHLDLYRLADPEELELLGLRDDLAGAGLLLVEWPERGDFRGTAPDLVVRLAHDGERRRVELDAASARARLVDVEIIDS